MNAILIASGSELAFSCKCNHKEMSDFQLDSAAYEISWNKNFYVHILPPVLS